MTKLAIKTEQIVDAIIQYHNGATDVTTADIREWCNDTGYNYQTIANRLSSYKSGRGKFNLVSAEAVKVLEESYNLPGAECIPTVVTDGVKVEATTKHSLVPVSDEKFVLTPLSNFH